jgi:hypothetical protein
MSRDVLEKIIGRAAMDSKFRRGIVEDPERTLEEYELTVEQVAAIKAIPMGALEKFAHKLMEALGEVTED